MKDLSKIKYPDRENEPSAAELLGVKQRDTVAEEPKPETIMDRIAAILPKAKGEKIIVKLAHGNFYRVNWYLPSGQGDTVVANWKITSSRYMEVTESGKSLNIIDRTIIETAKTKAK